MLEIPDTEVLQLAGCAVPSGHVDPIVAQLLAAQPVETQRLVLAMLMVMKLVVKDVSSTARPHLGLKGD